MNSQASETNQQGGHLTTLVERAEPYAALLRRAHLLAEPEAPTELRLQALWQSPKRPKDLALPDGTPVEVLDPGHWNRTAGPDFRDALLSIGGALRRGDVELHLRPVDWDVHGHAADPAYAGVILHVTWLPGPPAKTLPAAVPTLALAPFAERQGKTIDFTALPTPQEDNVDPRPCRLRLEGDPGGLDRLLVSAGAYRLLVKSRAFSEALRAGDPFQAFYEALLGAMGYRRNVAPFRRLAQEIPFARLQQLPSLRRFAILAGVSGLLKEERRDLWDLWWDSGFPPSLRPYEWDFRALRPQNHPFRRLAGAVGVLHRIDRLLDLSLGNLPEALVEASTLLCEPLALKGALIGANRAHAIVTNLFVPYRLALGTLSASSLDALPGEDISQPMREAWLRLSGSLRDLPKGGLRQQGLLQIHADFCANPALSCQTCPLADA